MRSTRPGSAIGSSIVIAAMGWFAMNSASADEAEGFIRYFLASSNLADISDAVDVIIEVPVRRGEGTVSVFRSAEPALVVPASAIREAQWVHVESDADDAGSSIVRLVLDSAYRMQAERLYDSTSELYLLTYVNDRLVGMQRQALRPPNPDGGIFATDAEAEDAYSSIRVQLRSVAVDESARREVRRQVREMREYLRWLASCRPEEFGRLDGDAEEVSHLDGSDEGSGSATDCDDESPRLPIGFDDQCVETRRIGEFKDGKRHGPWKGLNSRDEEIRLVAYRGGVVVSEVWLYPACEGR